MFDRDQQDYTHHCDLLLARMHARQPHAIICISHGKGAPYLAVSEGIFRTAPTVVEHVVNTLGAGDAFMAGVCAGLLNGHAPEGCLQLGHALAGAVIQQEGPQLGKARLMELRQDLEHVLKTGKTGVWR